MATRHNGQWREANFSVAVLSAQRPVNMVSPAEIGFWARIGLLEESCTPAACQGKAGTHTMMQPKIYIAATTGSTGSTSAMLHLELDSNVYGWFLEASDRQVSAGFFMLENFYAHCPPVLYRSVADDVYGDWIRDHPPGNDLMRCPVPDCVVHELERLQSKLAHDWLYFDGEPCSAVESAAYHQHGMDRRAANIRSRKLNRLVRDNGGRHHWTTGFDQNVLDYLQKYARIERCVLVRQ